MTSSPRRRERRHRERAARTGRVTELLLDPRPLCDADPTALTERVRQVVSGATAGEAVEALLRVAAVIAAQHGGREARARLAGRAWVLVETAEKAWRVVKLKEEPDGQD